METTQQVTYVHCKHLNKLCRLCGKIALTYRDKRRGYTTYQCSNLSKDILTVLGIDVSTDDDRYHPQTMCHQCYKVLQRTRQTGSVHLRARVPAWASFPRCGGGAATCGVCARYGQLLRGGRRRVRLWRSLILKIIF